MIYLYVLVAMSVTNLSDVRTIQYFATNSECIEEKHRYAEENEPYVYDCWIVTVKEK